jgi:hypothetical protein
MRWHARAGHLQYLRTLDTDAAAADGDYGAEDGPGNIIESRMKEDALPCELGIRYPTLQAILSGKRNIQTTLVSDETAYSYMILLRYSILYHMLFSLTGARAQD